MGRETDYVRFEPGTEDATRMKTIIDREWSNLNESETNPWPAGRWRDRRRDQT